MAGCCLRRPPQLDVLVGTALGDEGKGSCPRRTDGGLRNRLLNLTWAGDCRGGRPRATPAPRLTFRQPCYRGAARSSWKPPSARPGGHKCVRRVGFSARARETSSRGCQGWLMFVLAAGCLFFGHGSDFVWGFIQDPPKPPAALLRGLRVP